MIKEAEAGEVYRSLGRIRVVYRSLNVLVGALRDFIFFSIKNLYKAPLMVLLRCFSQFTFLCKVTTSSFIDSPACSFCMPFVSAGGGMALVEVWKCVTTVFWCLW